jgi:hypothetical protein
MVFASPPIQFYLDVTNPAHLSGLIILTITSGRETPNQNMFLDYDSFQSDSSNSKMSLTFFSNILEIFSDNNVDGTYFSDSIALIV